MESKKHKEKKEKPIFLAAFGDGPWLGNKFIT